MAQYFRETKDRLVVCITKNLDFPPHIHEELELVYLYKGQSIACCADQVHHLREGDFFLAFPEQVHHYYGSRDCEAFLIIVSPGQLPGIKQKTPLTALYHSEDEALVSLLKLTVQEHMSHKDETTSAALLTAAVRMLLRHYELRDDPTKDDAATQIVRYCSSHYREPLSVPAIAKALYLSQSRISHVFNDKLKISFSDYVNSLRLDEAVRLLAQDKFSMEQIAELSGFPTTRTFHRVFRKKYAMSPREYKRAL